MDENKVANELLKIAKEIIARVPTVTVKELDYDFDKRNEDAEMVVGVGFYISDKMDFTLKEMNKVISRSEVNIERELKKNGWMLDGSDFNEKGTGYSWELYVSSEGLPEDRASRKEVLGIIDRSVSF